MVRLEDITPLPARLRLKVTPNAKHPKIQRVEDDEGLLYRVYVGAPPENGKANTAVIAALAKAFGHPKSKITVVTGQTSQWKQVQFDT